MRLKSQLEEEIRTHGLLGATSMIVAILTTAGSAMIWMWGYVSRDVTISFLMAAVIANSVITAIVIHNANSEKTKLVTTCNWLTNQLDQKTRQLRECRAQLDDYSFMSRGAMKKASATYRVDAVFIPTTPEETRLQEIKTMLESYKDIVKED